MSATVPSDAVRGMGRQDDVGLAAMPVR
jgi:hypothetical protein